MTVILVRHGRSIANSAGILAGRQEGIGLDDTGIKQSHELVNRLRHITPIALYSSPLLRCRQTLEPLAQALNQKIDIENQLIEVEYGHWTGQKITELYHKPEWKVVQNQPSAAVFPGGESLAEMSYRSVSIVRSIDKKLSETHGEETIWVACTHGDIIKAVIADAYGMHLDNFQRIVVNPCSVSIIRYSPVRPFVELINSTSGDVTISQIKTSQAIIGGETGNDDLVATTESK